MIAWWTSLSSLTQGFFAAAVFFSVIFVWQLFSSLAGVSGDQPHDMGGGGGADMHDLSGPYEVAGGHDMAGGHEMFGDHGVSGAEHPGEGQTHEAGAQYGAGDHAGMITLRLFSIRSIVAFGTLFCWAAALYLSEARTTFLAVGLALIWGLVGMLVVAVFFAFLPRLTEEGTENLNTAIGRTGQVYINIPEDGAGQIRVLVDDTVSFVKARSRGGKPIMAGTEVRVVGRVDASTLEVEPASEAGVPSGKGG